MATKAGRWWRALALAATALVAALVLLATLAALDNRRLPDRSHRVDRLSDLDKARLGEALHLHSELGDSIWPGWAGADLPVILYNESYAFLVGYRDPPPGWIKVPGNRVRGGAWQLVPGDDVRGTPYYRQPLTAPGVSPEAFTVRVGERWVASLPTKEWVQIALTRRMRDQLPRFLAPVIPYRVVVGLFVGGSDGYISLIMHEAFHAHQGAKAPDRLAAAENVTAVESDYPGDAKEMRQAWQQELELLRKCARATSPDETRSLTRQFLVHRQARRDRQHLSARLIDYERQREWLEGLGRYVELEAWRRAAKTTGYEPLPALARDPDFRRYTGFDGRWSRELGQMRFSTGDEARFYAAGMAQAVVLDQLSPGWKVRAFSEGTWLEGLVAEVAGGE